MLFVRTDATGVEYNCLTHEMNPKPRPNLSITSKRKSHSTLSNAFSASSDTTASGSHELHMLSMLKSLSVVGRLPPQHEACLIW